MYDDPVDGASTGDGDSWDELFRTRMNPLAQDYVRLPIEADLTTDLGEKSEIELYDTLVDLEEMVKESVLSFGPYVHGEKYHFLDIYRTAEKVTDELASRGMVEASTSSWPGPWGHETPGLHIDAKDRDLHVDINYFKYNW